MHVLITGGAGFLGSHLVDRTLRDGHTVTIVDDLSTGSMSNLRDALATERATFVHGDVGASSTALVDVLAGAGTAPLDAIYHLASPASPKAYAAHQRETLAVNSLGTMACVDLAVRASIPLLFASTSEVYGDPLEHPQRETYFGNVNPVGPRSCYDEGKRFGEAVVAAGMREHALRGRIVRLFNAYGPRMTIGDGRLIPTLLEALEAKRPFLVHGTGEQMRSMTHVSDVIDGLITVMATEFDEPQPINLGSHDERTVNDIAGALALVAQVPFAVESLPGRPEDPQRRQPDLTRARRLGWEPKVPLEIGLRETYAWYVRQQLTST